MKKIVLLCAGGMSTSILVNKMREQAKTNNYECDINAYAVESILKTGKDADCILLGPQVGYKLDELSAMITCPMGVIDLATYGMMDGKTALNQAMQLMGE